MLAPSRLPPCVTSDETDDRCRRTATGPQAVPWVLLMGDPLGRICERAKPVPPPNFWTMAASLAELMIPSMLSSSPMTKQADRVPCFVPAFMRVGEFGTNSRFFMA